MTISRCAALIVALAAIAAAPPDETIRVRYAWSAPTDCRRHAAIVDVTAKFDARTRQTTARGHVRHRGERPIRDVTVCIGHSCTTVSGVMSDGHSAAFEIHESERAGKPTLRCSILEERVGA